MIVNGSILRGGVSRRGLGVWFGLLGVPAFAGMT